MLIGTSLPAILLAKQSAAIMIDAPVSPLSMHVPKSLFLSSILAICGATNPIKLMIPVTQTVEATRSVENPNTIHRTRFTLIPSIRASSSPRDSSVICHLNKMIPMKPARKTGKITLSLSIVIFAKLPIAQ